MDSVHASGSIFGRDCVLAAVSGVKMRWQVIFEKHTDQDPVE
jgi:hypothetical protein